MKDRLGPLVLAITVVWLLMAIYPPWKVVQIDPGRESYDLFMGYGRSIFNRPDPEIKSEYYAYVDFVKLGVSWLLAALAMAVSARFIKPLKTVESDAPRPTQSNKFFIAALACCGLIAYLLKDDFAQQYINRAPVPEVIERSSVIYAAKDIPSDTVVTPDQIEMKMLNKKLIPDDAAVSLAQVNGHRTKQKLEIGHIIPKSALAR